MSDVVQGRALEPFFTTRANEGGTGLGLATVYGIVTGAGGTMSIYSEPGEGTEIVLHLPTTTAAVEPLVALPASGPSDREEDTVVLIAEDEQVIRELTTRILVRNGYTVLAAASGLDALELTRRTPRIDLVLTDVIMPGMTGTALAAALGLERPDLPIVFMSGYSDQMVARRGILAADVHYLRKPFKSEQLLQLLAEALVAPV
jgi:CheY-like chemotaxis protein